MGHRLAPATIRTGDLPAPQAWDFIPTNRVRDGRLIIAGGRGLDEGPTHMRSRKAFVYDLRRRSTVDTVDPDTGIRTGKKSVVRGGWDYTRRADGTITTLSSGHVFGNAVLLHDGRVLMGGGHQFWDFDTSDMDDSVLATNTDGPAAFSGQLPGVPLEQ
jgi:sugar lactone lactonase YvrE